MRKPGQRGLLFISAAFAAVLLVQGAVDVLVPRTMFPTVSMPGFDVAPGRDGRSALTELSIHVHDASGASKEVQPEKLMSPLMYSAVRATLQRFVRYGEGGPLEDSTKEWLFERAEDVSGMEVDEIEFVWQRDEFDIVTLDARPIEEPEIVRVTR